MHEPHIHPPPIPPPHNPGEVRYSCTVATPTRSVNEPKVPYAYTLVTTVIRNGKSSGTEPGPNCYRSLHKTARATLAKGKKNPELPATPGRKAHKARSYGSLAPLATALLAAGTTTACIPRSPTS